MHTSLKLFVSSLGRRIWIALVIEAMSQGKPTLSKKDHLAGVVGGDLAYYFESFEEEAMAHSSKKS
ncbi:MAG: hypothetical protein IPI90_15690 [Saprospiraceae bacterium]|nr:hypothetical protein [Candidatus Vicinibacter affinis]